MLVANWMLPIDPQTVGPVKLNAVCVPERLVGLRNVPVMLPEAPDADGTVVVKESLAITEVAGAAAPVSFCPSKKIALDESSCDALSAQILIARSNLRKRF